MPGLPIVDYVYRSFVEGLPPSLRRGAGTLAYSLGLTASPDAPWSHVFPQEVTLGLPLLLAEAMPGVDPALVHNAMMAHALTVIGTYCNDWILDGDEEPTPELRAVLDAMFQERDRAMEKLGSPPDFPEFVFALADEAAAPAIAEERAMLERQDRCNFEVYDHFTMEKHYPSLPASMMLARAAGLSGERLGLVLEIVMGIELGLQIRQDARSWEDDHERGGSWVISLVKHLESKELEQVEAGEPEGMGADAGLRGRSEPPLPITSLEEARRRVMDSDVLVRLLDRSRVYLGIARSAAQALGMDSIACWAEREEIVTAKLAEQEARIPGFAVRWEKLLEADRRTRRELASRVRSAA
jgi:hypothetical protein